MDHARTRGGERALSGDAWLPSDVPDRSRLVPLPWGRVYVVDAGPAPSVVSGGAPPPPLVLLHGLFLTHYAFDALIPLLARGRRIVAIDLPGAGDSDHPAIADAEHYSLEWLAAATLAITAVLGCPRFDLLGHDFGGAIAITLAATARERVRKLVLLDPVVMSVSLPFEGPLGVVPSLGVDVFKRAIRRVDLKRLLVQSSSAPELVSEAEVAVYWDRLGRHGAREATHAMLGQLGALVRLRERFADVVASTVVVWGDGDRIVPPVQGERLAQLLPSARLELIEGSGHNPARERPAEVARIIEAHCSRDGS